MLLREFSFMPHKTPTRSEDYVDYVAKFALSENWGLNNTHLERYIDYNFELAYVQGLVHEATDKSFALWRVGNLVTRDNEPISILCTRNRQEGKQPYYFTRVFNTRRIEVVMDGTRTIVPVPASPMYAVPDYQSSYDLTYNFDHYLIDNRERAEVALANLTENQRFLCIYAAALLAHKRSGLSAVPQWYRDRNADQGSYQWLLPLHINSGNIDQKPDLVATLVPADTHGEYAMKTLLLPEWAYPHARAISSRDPQFRAWA